LILILISRDIFRPPRFQSFLLDKEISHTGYEVERKDRAPEDSCQETEPVGSVPEVEKIPQRVEDKRKCDQYKSADFGHCDGRESSPQSVDPHSSQKPDIDPQAAGTYG